MGVSLKPALAVYITSLSRLLFVCLFVSCPFKLRMGVTLHVVVFHTGVKMQWSNLCNARLGTLRSTRACASCFVHSVCQASSGEIHLCLKNSPNVLAGLNAILALVILPRCFLWPKCPMWLLMPAVFQKAAPATWLVWGTQFWPPIRNRAHGCQKWLAVFTVHVQVVRSPVGV